MSMNKKAFRAVVAAAAISVLATVVATVSPAQAAANACAGVGTYAKQPGKTVEIMNSVTGQENARYQAALIAFQNCTGITINWNGANDFESQLGVRVQGGTAPDIAMIPQPGLLQKMVATGKVVKAPAQTLANVNKYWSAGWKGYGTVNGTFYAAPNSANNKSLVWYSPAQFKKFGYTVPTTWDQLMALSDKMAAKGQIAWCGGLGSGTATGWPGTDWLEEIVLRTQGAQVYADWISHKVKFSDPKIIAAFDKVASFMKNAKYVGDVKAIATTTFQAAGQGIPTSKCMMLQQASFYASQYPANVKVSATGDVWAFYLPGINPAVKTPVEGGGEFFAAFNSSAATQEVQNYLSSPQWAIARIAAAGPSGGWLSANNGVPASAYTNGLDALSAKYLSDKNSTFVFDASDAMPAAVGAGTMWTELTNWFTGKSTADVAAAIDASWPTA
jgi:alpha-glucoside transport system substrate-binding protein